MRIPTITIIQLIAALILGRPCFDVSDVDDEITTKTEVITMAIWYQTIPKFASMAGRFNRGNDVAIYLGIKITPKMAVNTINNAPIELINNIYISVKFSSWSVGSIVNTLVAKLIHFQERRRM